MTLKKVAVLVMLTSFSGALSYAADDDVLSLGKQTFAAQCVRCHGADGKGNGPDAIRLYVPPRDFTSGRFKFKSTANGTPPSDSDLINGILGHGITGSGMPSFANLEPPVKNALVQYIKTFSNVFQGPAPQPIADPANMKAAADMGAGKQIFEKLQCALCHGVHGRANGTSAATLVDAWSRPIKPTDLTQGWTYGGGPKPIDIYHRIMAGIDGAPMPSYDGAATREEAWSLSNYVASLQLKANWSDDINVLQTDGSLPTRADDALWGKAEQTDIILDAYWIQNGKRISFAVNAVSVQAVANKDGVSFRLVWDDPVKSDKSPVDGVLMALKPRDYQGDPRGNLHNLYESDSAALDITGWNAAMPESVGQGKTNLYSWTRLGTKPNVLKTASAAYDDGQWTVVFTRPFDNESFNLSSKENPLQVAFAAWSGDAGENDAKHPASRWIRLHYTQMKAKH